MSQGFSVSTTIGHKLSTVPQAEQCGRLNDRLGVAWQRTPADLGALLNERTWEQVVRVTEMFLRMKQHELSEVRQIYVQRRAGADENRPKVGEMIKLHTYLNFAGNAEEALRFYERALRGELTPIVRFKYMPIEGVELPEEDQGKVMHVGLRVEGDQMIMASDTLESLGQKLVVGNNAYISLHPDSKEEADRLFAVLSEGGAVEMPMADQVWGDYFGSFKDKFGVQWMINYAKPK